MPPLSHRARTALGSALETALSRAGSAVDRGALRVMRRAWQRGGRLPDDARARMVAMAEHYAAAA
ncbi:MAG TPA: hypothetical protein VKZ63_03720, partial [Kofleriaceae bacterium]|nr:hypothetical protein [Kofleriaceae bacterium]